MEKYKNTEELTYSQFKEALVGTNVAIWHYNIDENKLVASDNWEDITGYDIGKFKNLFEFIEKTAMDKDRESAINDLNFYMEGKTLSYYSVYRTLTEKKEIRWILLRGKSLEDFKGRVNFLSGLVADITKEKNNEEEIRKMAHYDSITGLPNRDLFLVSFKNVLQETKVIYRKGALILIDLDNFKSINDTLGHDYGDLMLKIYSQLLNVCAKTYGRLFHLSADEFIILVDEFNSAEELKELCSNILAYGKKPFELNEKQIYITASIGVSIFPEHSSDMNDLLKFADLAMYQSKAKGKNTFTFFEISINKAYRRQVLIEQELKNSIKDNELYLVYQPQINALENKVVGLEALLRWNNKVLGFVPPNEFIPIAEKTGIMIEIGDWVLEKVCNKICELNGKVCGIKTVSVNISPIQIKEPNFKNKIIKVCEKNGIPLNLLELEITEGTLIRLNEQKTDDLNKMIKKGINISIDDFGTGYSSLNYLTALPVNTLKIDKSFIDNIENEKNKAVIECIMNLSKSLKYKVIAEGVETKEQLDLIMKSGCNIIQGYYFSKPVIEEELEVMLTDQ